MLFGDVGISPSARSLLLKHRVPVSFLDGRGRYLGAITPSLTPTPSLREAQYARAADAAYARGFAAALLERKLCLARQVLLRHRRNYPDLDLWPALSELADLREEITKAPALETMRGLEGRAAALYFDAFAHLLRHPSSFTKRTRRPPRDPVNALLSFGYSILHAQITGQVAAVGLDPQVGFLHVRRAGRAALPLDLVEEFRAPVVDRLVLRCWNLGILGETDFTWDEKDYPVLTQTARGTFLSEYARVLRRPFRHAKGFWTSYQRLLHGQARAVAHCVRHGEQYQGLPARL